MFKPTLKLSLVSLLLIFSQACAAPTAPTLDPNAIDTAIAQTFEAALTQTAQPGIPITGPETPTPTLTLAASPTPFFTPTLVALTSQVSVSVATNCRLGPGQGYGRVGALLVSEVAEVVGRSASGEYWIIRNPDRPGETCWLWGGYATLTGVSGALPVFTPPPTPTPTRTRTPQPTATRTATPRSSSTPTSMPAFTASYSGIESCTGTGWWVELELNNTGTITFQSFALVMRDTTTGTDLTLYSDDFTNRNGCAEIDTRADLPAGTARTVSSPIFAEDITGRALRATITLCSSPAQNGRCVTQTIDFTP